MLSVLMFHALYDGDGDWNRLDAMEKPYAWPLDRFKALLGALKESPVNVLASPDAPLAPGRNCLLTFDDGHASNATLAAPALEETGLRAVFFVTPEMMEREASFCDWPQLRAMSQAGHSIQGHGLTHRFLNDLSAEQCRHELAESKRRIEDGVGKPVTEMSFPGGRFGQREVALAREVGYRRLYTSRFGTHPIRQGDRVPDLVRRMAVRHQTSLALALEFARGSGWSVRRHAALAAGKAAVRATLGNQLYHRLYRLLR